MMGVGTLLVVCVNSHGGLINLTPGGKKVWYKEPKLNPPGEMKG